MQRSLISVHLHGGCVIGRGFYKIPAMDKSSIYRSNIPFFSKQKTASVIGIRIISVRCFHLEPQQIYARKNKTKFSIFLAEKNALKLCMLGDFSSFCCCLLTFLQNQLFPKFLSGTLSECETVLDPDQDRQKVVPDLGPNCLQIKVARKKLTKANNV